MLHIGPHTYELVRVQSGFVLWIEQPDWRCPSGQNWRLDAHFVPGDHGPSRRSDGVDEYLRLAIFPHDYSVRDWRELKGLGLEPLEDESKDVVWLGLVSVENLLAPRTAQELWHVNPGELKVRRTGDYLFTCEFDGIIKLDHREEELHFLDEIPFAEVCQRVPVNAREPVAYAHARAMREIGPFEIADSRVTTNDWPLKKDPNARPADAHEVVLRTAWQCRTA